MITKGRACRTFYSTANHGDITNNIIYINRLFKKYCIPNNSSKKYFADSDSALIEYLSVNETFYTWSDDNFVLSSYKVLYFPALFCVIPFNQIASLKPYKQLGEKGVYINLVNGKKICIVTKHVERIHDAVNAIQQTQ